MSQPKRTTTETEKLQVTHSSETMRRGPRPQQPGIGESVARAKNAELSMKVKAALNDDADLADDPISVSANNGTVTLTGEVAAQDQVKKVESVAAAVPGARFVLNEVTWPITRQ